MSDGVIRKRTREEIAAARAKLPEPREGADKAERLAQRREQFRDTTDELLFKLLADAKQGRPRKDGTVALYFDVEALDAWLEARAAIKEKFPDPEEPKKPKAKANKKRTKKASTKGKK